MRHTDPTRPEPCPFGTPSRPKRLRSRSGTVFRDPGFVPPRCPKEDCPAHHVDERAPASSFPWRRRGTYQRKVDRFVVQRYDCLVCGRSFSSQSFRLDYRLARPDTMVPTLMTFVAKCTMRRAARAMGVNRPHVARRLARLAQHSKRDHAHRIERVVAHGGVGTRFQFDELETFETDRKLCPVTVPVLVEARTGFIVFTDAAPLPARKPLKPAERARLELREEREGPRRSGSRASIGRLVEALKSFASHVGPLQVVTDKKSSYAAALRRNFGGRVRHERIDGRMERGPTNPLFPINHTLARLRDLVSRLVRQSWGASKKREQLIDHLAIVVAFRNYVDEWRAEGAQRRKLSAAQELGLTSRRIKPEEYLRWSDPLLAPE